MRPAGKGRAALILAFGKPKKRPGPMGDGMMGGKSPDDEDEGDESMGKQARLTMVKTMMQAVKDDDAESFKTALEDFIAAS